MSNPSNASETPELAFRAFIRAFGLVRSQMDSYFAQFGISGAQWGILRQLHRAEGEGKPGLNLTELVERQLLRPPSITSVVNRLVRLGLVARRIASWDQRVREISLTAAGRRLVTRVLEVHPRQIRRMLACFDEADQQQLHRLMDQFVKYVSTLDAGTATAGKRPIRLRRRIA